MSDHRENLDRVRQRITSRILEFRDRRGYETAWHADDLRNFVIEEVLVAPASADRVLRDLRQRGVLDYVLMSRRHSLYQFTRESPPESPPLRKPRRPKNKKGTDNNGQLTLL